MYLAECFALVLLLKLGLYLPLVKRIGAAKAGDKGKKENANSLFHKLLTEEKTVSPGKKFCQRNAKYRNDEVKIADAAISNQS